LDSLDEADADYPEAVYGALSQRYQQAV